MSAQTLIDRLESIILKMKDAGIPFWSLEINSDDTVTQSNHRNTQPEEDLFAKWEDKL